MKSENSDDIMRNNRERRNGNNKTYSLSLESK